MISQPPAEPDPHAAVTRTNRAVIFALTIGPLVLLGVALVGGVRREAVAPPNALPVLSVVAFLAAATVLPLSFVLPGLLTDAAIRRQAARGNPDADASALARVYSLRVLLSGLLTEGVAFLAAIAYLQPVTRGEISRLAGR